MSITRINEFVAAEGKAEALYEFLASLLPYIHASTGNIACELLRSDDDNSHFVVIEKWECKAAHKASLEAYPKDDMEAAYALFGQAPKGRCYLSDN